MKFMTPATVRNLPNYQREDRANLLMTQEAEEKAKANQEKKLLVQFGLDIQDAADKSPDSDTLNKSLGMIRDKYRAMGMTPEMMQMGANLARQFKQDFLANQDRQERKDDRARMLRKENIAESDVNLLGQIASGNIKPMGGDEFMVPATEQDASQGLSGAGQLRLIDIKNSMEDRGTAKEDRLLNRKLTELKIANEGKGTSIEQEIQALARLTGKPVSEVASQYLTQKTDVKGKADLGREKLFSDHYTALYKIAAEQGEVTPEKELAIKSEAARLSGFNPDPIATDRGGDQPAPTNRPPLSSFGSQPDKKPITTTDPKETVQAPEKYSNAKMIGDFVWATDSKGQTKRLPIKKQNPTIRDGKGNVVPNPYYPEYLKQLESLGIKQ